MLIPLSQLTAGQSGIIQEVTDEQVANVLLEMGFLTNEYIKLERIAPLGDPIIIHNGQYSLSIRKSEAQFVMVKINQ